MRFRTILFFCLLGLVGVYFIFEAQGVLLHPRLVVDEPRNGDRVRTPYVLVAGYSTPSADIWVNGQQLHADANGFFKTTLGLYPGYNPIEVRVKNRFGYETRVLRSVMLE